MRLLIAVVGMAVIGALAVVLVAVAAVIRLLPLIVAALLVLAAVRWSERRRRVPVAAPPPAPPGPSAFGGAPTARTIPQHPSGWVMVPVWMVPAEAHAQGRRRRHPVIDAEVISEDDQDG